MHVELRPVVRLEAPPAASDRSGRPVEQAGPIQKVWLGLSVIAEGAPDPVANSQGTSSGSMAGCREGGCTGPNQVLREVPMGTLSEEVVERTHAARRTRCASPR